MNRLYRSQRDKKLFGLCGGIAELLNIDATLLRLVVLVMAVFSGGVVILLYLLACIVIPKEPYPDVYAERRYEQPRSYERPGAYDRTRSYEPTRSYEQPKAYSAEDPGKVNIDEMMKDIEKKALLKEIAELRAKVAKYEKEEE